MKRSMRGYETIRIKDLDNDELIIKESSCNPKENLIISIDAPYIDIDKSIAKDIIYILQEWINTNMLCLPEYLNEEEKKDE